MRPLLALLSIGYAFSSVSADARLHKRLFGDALTTASTTETSATTTETAAVKTTGTAAPTSTALVTPSTKQTAVENKFWHNFKARGVNLGNWLLLEEWMDPVYYRNYSSTGKDEWTFCETLGAEKCEEVLSDHWTSWVTESDISGLAALNYNLLRIPIGFWALITTTGDEPYVKSTQMDQVERVMQYASDLGMYVVLDIHGLPGSQNGKEHSGHAGSIGWFTETNNARSLHAVTEAMNFITQSSNKAVIAAIEIMNEPNITTSKERKFYEDYITSATKIIHTANASMPVMFHDAFLGASDWSKFTKNQKDNYVLDIHNYFTSASSNSVTALDSICSFAKTQSKLKSKTPTFVGEFSVSVGGVYLDSDTWRQQFYETQVQQYSGTNVAGSAFWSLKAIGSNGTSLNNGWSILALEEAGLVSTSTWNLDNTLACPKSTGKSTGS